jgi:hypothetical protein
LAITDSIRTARLEDATGKRAPARLAQPVAVRSVASVILDSGRETGR